MNTIIFWTILTAVAASFFLTCIIGTVSTDIKKRKHGKRITIKPYPNNYGLIIFYGIIQGLNAGLAVYSLKDCNFTESVLNRIKIVCYLLIACTCILAYFLRTRIFLTEGGIVSNDWFFPPKSLKYSVETVEKEINIKLYTNRKKHDQIYYAKNKEAVSMLEKLYDEFDGNAPDVKFKSGTVKYLLTFLCSSLIFVGGIFAWYEIKKPVVFIGEKIVKTDSEYALFDSIGYRDIMFGFTAESEFDAELAKRGDEMYDYIDRTENLTPKDMAALGKMPNLKYISVYGNNITDLSEIGRLAQLEGLAFGARINNDIPEDYLPLKNLTNLKYFLGAGLENFHDLTVFENADELIYFELTCADIQSGLDIICEKENLLVLELFQCTAEDFSTIEKCVNLKSLGLSSTNVTDLSFLKNLNELEHLYINNIDVDDYSVLLDLPKLNHVFARDTKLPQEIIEKLTEKGVDVRK